jgi:Holliday junction resolvase
LGKRAANLKTSLSLSFDREKDFQQCLARYLRRLGYVVELERQLDGTRVDILAAKLGDARLIEVKRYIPKIQDGESAIAQIMRYASRFPGFSLWIAAEFVRHTSTLDLMKQHGVSLFPIDKGFVDFALNCRIPSFRRPPQLHHIVEAAVAIQL